MGSSEQTHNKCTEVRRDSNREAGRELGTRNRAAHPLPRGACLSWGLGSHSEFCRALKSFAPGSSGSEPFLSLHYKLKQGLVFGGEGNQHG